jgi:exodeoxyribonuclease V beta subunit
VTLPAPDAQNFDLASTPIEDGITLIEASAGTGKTYCLAGLVVRLLVERPIKVGQILVVTFTNAAANELSSRVREAIHLAHDAISGRQMPTEPWLATLSEKPLAAERLRAALLEIDELTVATIHGFCKQVLESHAFESGLPFDPEVLEDDQALLLQAAEDVWRRRLYPESPEAGLLAAIAMARGWTPATFLGAWRELHRHPNTRLAPIPLPLTEALALLGKSLRELALLFDAARLRLFLSRLPFHDRGRHSAGALAALVGEAEALLVGGDLAALPALGRLRRSQLAKTLRRGQEALAEHPFLDACEELFATLEVVEHAFRAAFLRDLDATLAKRKESAGVLTFDDLLRRLDAALGDPRLGRRLATVVRRRFQVALIDEFQDTDLLQWSIFRRLFAEGRTRRPLFLIGDPKQAIYRFRGADIFAYLEAKDSADRRYSLPLNWRSAAKLVDAVSALFQAAPAPFVFEDIEMPMVHAAPATAERRLVGYGDAERPLELWWLELAGDAPAVKRAIARHLATGVVELLASEPVLRQGDAERRLHAGDLAVLVRTNDEATLVQEALRAAGVPSVVAQAGDIFRSAEIAELERWLAAVVEAGEPRRLRSALATLLWGDDAPALARLADDDLAFQQLAEVFAGYREVWRRQGFVAACERLLEDRQVRPRLLALVDGERRMTNLRHAIETVHQAILERRLSPVAAVAWLAAERGRARHEREATELRLESDARAVHIQTIHKSKGLEFEVVFCPFLWRARRAERPVLAHLDASQLVLDFGLRDHAEDFQRHRALADSERLAEDLRLLYVALTRARQRCVVFWGRLGAPQRMAATGLAWLLHRGQRQLEALGLDRALQAAAAVEQAIEDVAGRADLWRADVLALARQAPIRIRDLDGDGPPLLRLEAVDEGLTLRARPLEDFRRRLQTWRIASFSSLSRGGRTLTAAADATEFADPSWPARAAPDASPAQGLFAFARGTRAGSCLHEVLELCDFGAHDTAGTVALIERTLERWGLADAATHAGGPAYRPDTAVVAMLGRVLKSALPSPAGDAEAGQPFALAEVGAGQRLTEWSFHLPLDPLAPADLARLLADFADELPPGYPARVALLTEQPVRGFLKGFVDLLLCHEGRYYVVDWKSNHLGDAVADYGETALALAMVEHHYVLQYLFYLVAAHRHLGRTLAGYDYARDVGGAYYVFLRGVDAGPAPSLFEASPAISGIFASRPSRALIERLDAAITAEQRSRR